MNILELKRKLLPMSGPQMDGGGGGGSGTGTQTQITELPEWARGYAKSALEKGAALSETPYQTYDQPRIAGFSPMQQQAQEGAANMQTSGATGAGIGIAGEAAMRGLGTQYQPGQFQNQFQAPEAYQAGRFGAPNVRAQGLNQYQMGPAQQVSAQNFGGQSAQDYMSPYMQNVVDVQQREAQRASDIQGQKNAAQAVGQGAFGGSRAALVEAERQRNLATQKGDIQATGQQAAYQNAQAQFNADQARQMAAQQSNQQAGLTTGQQNLNALLGVQSLGAGQNLQAQQLNQAARLQAQQLGEQSRQFGAGQGLQAASLGAQYGQAAEQLGEQSRQYGAGLGIQGLQTALQGAGQLGTLGGQEFQQGVDINKLQSAYGGQQQALRQQGLDQAYQDFQNQQNYPYKQLGFFSDLIRGIPVGQATTKSMYEPDPSMLQQVGSAGLGLYGLSKFMADGGMAYANGGEVEGYAGDNGSYVGGVDSRENVEEIVHSLRGNPEALQRAYQAAKVRGDVDQIEAIEKEMAITASLRNGIAGGVTNEMAERFASGGGILAFSKRGAVDSSSIDDDSDSLRDRYIESKGDPAVYGGFGKYGLEQLKRLSEMEAYEALTPEKRAALDKANYARIQAFGGEDPYAPMAERIKGFNADLAAQGERGKGAVALQMAKTILRPGSKARAIGETAGTMGEGLAALDAAQAREKRALAGMEFNLSDAQRKERMAAGREAIGATKDIEANRLAAHTAERADIVAGLTGAGKFAQAFRPVGGGGGAGKLPQVDRLAGQIATQIVDLKGKNPNDPQIKVLEDKLAGLKDVIATTKTSDKGPDILAMEQQKLAAMTDKDIDAQVRSDKFLDADWQDAMGDAKKQGEVERRIRNELLTRRNQAKTNSTGSGKLRFDAQGNPL